MRTAEYRRRGKHFIRNVCVLAYFKQISVYLLFFRPNGEPPFFRLDRYGQVDG